MKVDNIEHEKNRVSVRRNRLKNIIDWGENNDYPQSVNDIVSASYTGVTCLDVYRKFILGRGFADKDIYQLIVNDDGETADGLLEQITNDLAAFGGFAVHFNFNLLGQIVSIRYIPMQNVRKCIDDDEYIGKVALHPDWGSRGYKRFNEVPIEYIDLFTPSYTDFLERVNKAGGIYNYKGQVYIYSNKKNNYPLPIYESVLTDMSTQEAISNITYRNAKRGFLPAGCFAEINEYYDDSNEQDREAFDKVGDVLRGLQGDKNASSIMHVVVANKESVPQMVSLKGDNYDKEYEVSREACRKNIGQAFRQPEELRCEETASGFANDTMVQAYKVYNSITNAERQVVEREFSYIFKRWYQPLEYNFQIMPLSYGAETLQSRLGEASTTEVVTIATNKEIDINQRKAILINVYGLEEDEANKILLLHADND